ncbi:glycerophosphodiester phosphodiesterase [Luteipulveratus halotolerans]|uniref:glycerophosphodiester phosphodiesterase n=1 Tax=Luteipulveratus halotolerans TaxID=1631356 RepID=A0A0L6CHX6_9MICO|nr:glycerophosphodiester phosphodiesterase [Luteipulveratus halotolerans]KNX37406.1 glycerophosphodiester phosphodiesterase [Luteipulveratus halotolerans]
MDRRTFTGIAAATVASVVAAPSAAQAATSSARSAGRPGRRPGSPLVVGHRGASGYRPEHTLASYTLAAHLGADFIEPDLVITKDGVLVCRHEPEISGTTDVAQHPEFASRRTTKSLDGVATTGWFVEDFTLAELRTLRAVERLPELRQHNTVYNGLWQIPTFEEVLQLRKELSRDLGREIGVYPETKHPTYFRAMGLPLEERLVPLVRKHGLDRAKAPIFIQSFELKNLQDLRHRLGVKAPLVFLTSAKGGPFGDGRTYAELLTRSGMATYAQDIDGLGPDQSQVISRKADGSTGTVTTLVADAHANGLSVCPYTVRAENANLPTDYRTGTNPADFGRVLAYFAALYATGIDGIFSDMPDLAVLARDLD